MDLKQTELGIATITYDEDGAVELADFESTMKSDFDHTVLDQLVKIKQEEMDVLKLNADLILASWFLNVSEIEEADKMKYEVVSEVLKCEKYPNGRIKVCSIKYIFKER